jgi:hypothetical protein
LLLWNVFKGTFSEKYTCNHPPYKTMSLSHLGRLIWHNCCYILPPPPLIMTTSTTTTTLLCCYCTTTATTTTWWPNLGPMPGQFYFPPRFSSLMQVFQPAVPSSITVIYNGWDFILHDQSCISCATPSECAPPPFFLGG